MTQEEQKELWWVELEMVYVDHLYAIKRLAPAKDYTLTPIIYLEVQAVDELGAYNAVRTILDRLGFQGRTVS